jgi:shikimate kinase
MDHLKSISKIIYLKLPLRVIEKRLSSQYKNRGVVGSGSKTIKELFIERDKLYHSFADIIVDCHNDSTDEQFSSLCEILEK